MDRQDYEDRVIQVFKDRWEKLCQAAGTDRWWSEIQKVGELNRRPASHDLDGNPIGSTIIENGLPELGMTIEDDEWKWVIDPSREIPSNPFAQEVRLFWQIMNDPPPMPEPIPDHAHGKKDTTAFNAWADRHPDLRQSDIARLLGVNEKTIRRWRSYYHIDYPQS